MEWVILQPLHFRNLHFGRFLWANDLPSYHQKIQVASGAGQDTWKTRFGGSGTNDECYMAGQEWGFPCLPLQPIQKKTGYSILQLLTMVKKKWSHIITHTLCICRCVCVFNLLPLQGQIAGFQPGRGLYLENSWNILESKPNVGQFDILYVTSFKIL